MAFEYLTLETGEIIAGGVAGVPAADGLMGAVSGAMGWQGNGRLAANFVGKILWAAGWLGAAEWVDNEHASPFLQGLGAGPLMTLPNDVYRHMKGQDIQDGAYAWALDWRAQSQAGRAAQAVSTPAVGPSSAPGRRLLRATIPFRGGR